MLRVLAAANLALVLALGYGLYSMKGTLADRISDVESATQQSQTQTEQKLTDLSSDLELINKRVGVTSDELTRARETAQNLKRQQEQAAQELATQLATKASSSDVEGLRQEATTKMAELQQDSDTKIGTVTGEVSGVKQELIATRADWDRRLVDVKNVLSEGIAKNSTELADLRKKGERDYFEFDVRKNSKQPFQRVADIQIGLLRTDPKKGKYSVSIQVDDNRLEKRDRTTNEPVQFLVGRDELRYEVVVNTVEKDRIRGYISVPKDKVLSAEGPKFRQ